MEITYTNDLTNLSIENLQGFFVGWESAPTPVKLFKLLKQSDYRIVAKDGEKIVGFITAISDGVLAAYIPFLEVLPEYQGKGLGSELMSRMLKELNDHYMIDLLCDENLQSFYEKVGMSKASGMMIRNYENQSGKE